MTTSDPIPVGFCQCGCGARTNRKRRQRRGENEYYNYLRGHGTRKAVLDFYRLVKVRNVNGDKRSMLLHRYRAERALGKSLPVNAVVHHADGTKSDMAPLVICQDSTYHALLHVRMRVKAAGGDPDRDKICCFCHMVKPSTDFHRARATFDGRAQRCKSCENAKARRYWNLKRLSRSSRGQGICRNCPAESKVDPS